SNYVPPEGSLGARIVLINGRFNVITTADVFRFIKFIRPQSNGCWFWAGTKDKKGYAKFWYDGATRRGARFSFTVFKYELPIGYEPDHLCKIHQCVNPEHLDGVTKKENLLRGDSPVGINARKTHCIRGHAFDKANTRIVDNSRRCRKCAV